MTTVDGPAVAPARRLAAAVFLVAVFATAVGDEISQIAILLHFAAGGHAGLVASLLILQLAPSVLLAPSTQPQLRRLLPILVITVSASSMVNVAAPFFVAHVLHSGGVVLGVVTAAWGAGALVGALVASRRDWSHPERAVLVGAFVMGIAVLLFGVIAVEACTFAAAFLAGAANTYQNVAMRTAVQVRTPERLLGRAHAAAGSVVNSFFLVGFVLGGFFAAEHARAVYLVAGALTGVMGGLGLGVGRVTDRGSAEPVSTAGR